MSRFCGAQNIIVFFSQVEEKLQNVQVVQVHLNCTTFQKGILGAGTRKLRICGYLPKLMKSIICSDYDDVAMDQSERATRRDCNWVQL